MYSGQAVIMFSGAVTHGFGMACNPGLTGLDAVVAFDIDSFAIFLDFSFCDRSMKAQLLAANRIRDRLNRRTAH